MCYLNLSFITRGLTLFIVIIGISGAFPANSAENIIRFGIAEKGYPPYLMGGQSDNLGIVGDVFREISTSLGYRVEVISRPKKRLERLLEAGEIDAIAGALEWRNDAVDYVSTDGIIHVSDNVVMTFDRQAENITADQLKGKHVVTRAGYIYPSLEDMFADGTIDRATTGTFESLLKMVAHKRVDYGIIDVNVANWEIRKNALQFSSKLYFSKPGFDEVEFRVILFSKKWAPFVKEFNETLATFKASHGWQNILNNYN